MKFAPIKYKQPLFGDSRCALYALANILGDGGILLYRDVGQKTTTSEENDILKAYIVAFGQQYNGKISGIYPHIIVPSEQRIPFDWVVKSAKETPKECGNEFTICLIDFLSNDGFNAHTVGSLWFDDEFIAIIDPQKDFVSWIDAKIYFEQKKVVGLRCLHNDAFEISEFTESDLPHLFLPQEETVTINEYSAIETAD